MGNTRIFLSPRRVSPLSTFFTRSTIPEEKWGLLVVYTAIASSSEDRRVFFTYQFSQAEENASLEEDSVEQQNFPKS